MTSSSLTPYLAMLLGSLSFALMATLTHALGSHCDWQVIVLVRAGMALLLTAAITIPAGVRLSLWKPRTLWMRSLAGSISLICTFYALPRLPVAEVLTLTNMFPIWVALLSWPLLGEQPSGLVWFSVVSGVIGVALIQQPHFAGGTFATLVALAASFSTAVAMIGLHRLQGIDARAVIVHFSAVAVLFCVVAFFLGERTRPLENVLEGPTLLMLLGVGVTATIGQFFLTKAFTFAQPARVAVVGLTQIIFALGFDLLFWHPSVDSMTLLGMGMVVAPTACLMAYRA